MAEDKTFPPTLQKLGHLRATGIIPYSKYLTSAGVLVGLSLGFAISMSYFEVEFAAWAQHIFSFKYSDQEMPFASPDLAIFEGVYRSIFFLILILCGGALGGLLVGVLQTRMYFSLRLKSADRSVSVLQRRLRSLFGAIISLMILSLIARNFILSNLHLPKSQPELIRPFDQDNISTKEVLFSIKTTVSNSNKHEITELLNGYKFFGILIISSLIITGMASRIVAALFFNLDNRMSRAELAAESLEDGVPVATKDAMDSFNNESD